MQKNTKSRYQLSIVVSTDGHRIGTHTQPFVRRFSRASSPNAAVRRGTNERHPPFRVRTVLGEQRRRASAGGGRRLRRVSVDGSQPYGRSGEQVLRERVVRRAGSPRRPVDSPTRDSERQGRRADEDGPFDPPDPPTPSFRVEHGKGGVGVVHYTKAAIDRKIHVYVHPTGPALEATVLVQFVSTPL